MNPIEEEMRNFLMHYGTPKHSGRYPWGSGKEPYQHSADFLSRVEELEKQGLSEVKVAEALGMKTTELRIQRTLAKNERRTLLYDRARSLREDGLSLNEIAKKMGYPNDSSVRSLLNENAANRMNKAQETAEILKKELAAKGMLDVGVGVERELNISQKKMQDALYILKMQGYEVYGLGVPTGTNKQTNLQVLCPPGTEHSEAYAARDAGKIRSITDYESHDGGETFDPKWVYPKSMDSSRIKIRYAEEGGLDKDGLVEIRRGVDDLSLGNSHYSQVRILVDNSKYIKGMAVYSDDMPDGVDIVFNTNKKSDVPKMKVLKDIQNDPDNPFGSLIKEGIDDPDRPSDKRGGQSYYYDKNGNKQLSLINKRADEGDWEDWDKALPSQFLSKQPKALINKQLKIAMDDKQAEFDEICELTNPTIKKVLLKSFADDCDSSAVHLKAAALPGQKYRVIMPIPSLKDNEVYAPTFDDGDQVALVRFPHGGTFEIPLLTVNNKHAKAKQVLGNAKDAIGINKKNADRLSGADFDGDTVLVIPNSKKIKIMSTPPLDDLKNFDAKEEYPERPGMKYMKRTVKDPKTGKERVVSDNTQTEMGKISNLITDMTIKGANDDEIVRAVKHSMVVIDAAKHKLDYKRSEEVNGIAALKKLYQGAVDERGRLHTGASTLISRASSETQILKRKGSPKINQKGKDWYDPDLPEGELIWNTVREEYKLYKKVKDPDTGKYVINPDTGKPLKIDTGKTKFRTQSSTQMADTRDARTLSSGFPQEEAYADYANWMKSMGNKARKEMVYTGKIEFKSSAKATYQNEVNSLQAKLNIALKNAPRERLAQINAHSVVEAKKLDNPDMTDKEIKKAKQQALTAARTKYGSKREPIKITDREWEAIQAGAISENNLYDIISNTDKDDLRKRATPRSSITISTSKINRIATLSSNGYSISEIARALDLPTSTVSNYIK